MLVPAKYGCKLWLKILVKVKLVSAVKYYKINIYELELSCESGNCIVQQTPFGEKKREKGHVIKLTPHWGQICCEKIHKFNCQDKCFLKLL